MNLDMEFNNTLKAFRVLKTSKGLYKVMFFDM